MKYTPLRLNVFTFFKLPSVWWCGVRVKKIEKSFCEATVVHRWINQNPFQSMFWAVQGMAAELTTGVLIMQAVQNSNKKVSMLVLNNRANFSKKARGKISFTCDGGDEITKALKNLISSNEPQTLWLNSKGTDPQGDVVASFEFECTLLLKK